MEGCYLLLTSLLGSSSDFLIQSSPTCLGRATLNVARHSTPVINQDSQQLNLIWEISSLTFLKRPQTYPELKPTCLLYINLTCKHLSVNPQPFFSCLFPKIYFNIII